MADRQAILRFAFIVSGALSTAVIAFAAVVSLAAGVDGMVVAGLCLILVLAAGFGLRVGIQLAEMLVPE